ncbi:MAG: orotate phosphoribosyltransferase [Acidobacteriota bacterium]|nr:orotate phosphoribosyltransferase [Acidobacteriota bacterium]
MASQADSVLNLFQATGAYLKGHFRLTSGLHSGEYLQSALVLRYPRHAEELGGSLASSLKEVTSPREIGLVVAPALGGLIIGHEVARALNTPFLFAERDASGRMTLRRGFTVDPGATAVVVEDVITTGGSTREVIEILQNLGVSVLAAGSIVDRSAGTATLGVPRASLVTLDVISYPPETCPMCREGIPVSKPGSRNTG